MNKETLKKNYECACNAYVAELLKRWELDAYYGYWIADDVGEMYAYGDSIFITMADIIYCVEHDVTEQQYQEWQDYTVDAAEFNLTVPNLRAWMDGCPRTSPEKFEQFRKMKAELERVIEEEKLRETPKTNNNNGTEQTDNPY